MKFDDIAENDDGVWTYLCGEHAKKVNPRQLDDGCCGGVCGVKGCWTAAEYYYDFTPQGTIE